MCRLGLVIARLVSVAFLAGLSMSRVFSAPAYDHEVVAATGQLGLVSIGRSVSINDGGRVAFVGRRSTGENIFVGIPGSVHALRSSENLNLTFGQAVQISNDEKVVARDFLAAAPGSLPTSKVRIWDAKAVDSSVTLAHAGIGAGFDFGSTVSNAVGINNKNDVVFVGANGATTLLAVPWPCIAPGPNGIIDSIARGDDFAVGRGIIRGSDGICDSQQVGGDDVDAGGVFGKFLNLSQTIPVRPMVSDDGWIVVRSGNEANSPIRVINWDFFPPPYSPQPVFIDIASSTLFEELGQRPGISDDGSIVAFYGKLSPSGATALGLSGGKGIFASIRLGGQWFIHQIAEIGGNSPFSDFDPNGRVAVNNVRQVVYMASSSGGKKGIYVSQIGFFLVDDGGHKRFRMDGQPRLIAEQGQSVALLGAITDLDLHDPINNHGDLVFWGSTGSGEAVVRVKRGCSVASSNYSDPQTSTYINQYDAGTNLGMPHSAKGAGGDCTIPPPGNYQAEKGGNACGPSSLAMLVNAAKRTNDQSQRAKLWIAGTPPVGMFMETMLCKNQGNDTNYRVNSFNFWEGKNFLQSLGYKKAEQPCANQKEDCYAHSDAAQKVLDDLLDQGKPVVAATHFGKSAHPGQLAGKFGGGHVVLFLGRTAKGDYIVNDPAGDYFSSSAADHYGPGKCGELRIYSKEKIAALDNAPGPLYGIRLDNNGSGYTCKNPVVDFIGGGGTGAKATATVLDLAGSVYKIAVTKKGSGYASAPTVSITGGGGTGATASAQVKNGTVTDVTVVNRGAGYSMASPPAIAFSGGGGNGATATAKVAKGTIDKVTLDIGGTGYVSAPKITFSGCPAGTGGAAAAIIYDSFVLTEGRMLVIPPDPMADPEVLGVSFRIPLGEVPLIALWLEDGLGRRTGFLADNSTVDEIPDSAVSVETLSPTNPDLTSDDVVAVSKLYGISVVTPDPAMRVFVQGIKDTNYTLGVDRLANGETLAKMTKTGTVFVDEVQEVKLVPDPVFVLVPSLGGLTQAAASATLQSVGLVLGTVTYQNSNTVAAGLVMAQQPAAAEQANFGGSVNLTISLGPSGLRGDLNGDGVVDQKDLDIILAARNTIVAQGDPRDLDGDGRVTALDARILTTLCARPRCATK